MNKLQTEQMSRSSSLTEDSAPLTKVVEGNCLSRYNIHQSTKIINGENGHEKSPVSKLNVTDLILKSAAVCDEEIPFVNGTSGTLNKGIITTIIDLCHEENLGSNMETLSPRKVSSVSVSNEEKSSLQIYDSSQTSVISHMDINSQSSCISVMEECSQINDSPGMEVCSQSSDTSKMDVSSQESVNVDDKKCVLEINRHTKTEVTKNSVGENCCNASAGKTQKVSVTNVHVNSKVEQNTWSNTSIVIKQEITVLKEPVSLHGEVSEAKVSSVNSSFQQVVTSSDTKVNPVGDQISSCGETLSEREAILIRENAIVHEKAVVSAFGKALSDQADAVKNVSSSPEAECEPPKKKKKSQS